MEGEFVEVFQFNESFFYIKKDPHESREVFIERVYFILKNIGDISNGVSYEEIEKRSKLYVNHKYLSCGY